MKLPEGSCTRRRWAICFADWLAWTSYTEALVGCADGRRTCTHLRSNGDGGAKMHERGVLRYNQHRVEELWRQHSCRRDVDELFSKRRQLVVGLHYGRTVHMLRRSPSTCLAVTAQDSRLLDESTRAHPFNEWPDAHCSRCRSQRWEDNLFKCLCSSFSAARMGETERRHMNMYLMGLTIMPRSRPDAFACI